MTSLRGPQPMPDLGPDSYQDIPGQAKGNPKKARKAKGLSEQPAQAPCQAQEPIIYNTIERDIEVTDIPPIDYKTELTDQEYKFISLHLTANIDPISAVIINSYRQYSEKHAYAIALKIITLV